MSIEVGDETGIIICNAISGGEPDLVASTLKIYLYAESLSPSYSNQAKIRQQSGGVSTSDKSGKRSFELSFSNLLIFPPSSGLNYTELYNAYIGALLLTMIPGARPIYIFVKNLEDDEWIVLSTERTGTATKYMKGYPTTIRPIIENGTYKFASLGWTESLY